jgi:signal transduction histidine kinase
MLLRNAKSKLVVALTLFAAIVVGLTGGILLTRSRAALLEGLIERQALLVRSRAHLLSDELRGLETELERLARLADIDLTDQNMEPEKRVLRIARKDSITFSAGIAILDGEGNVSWTEPRDRQPVVAGSTLARLARERRAPIVVARPGELDVATPIPSTGTMVGFIDLRSRDLFGDAIRKTLGKSGVASLVGREGEDFLASAGGAEPPLLRGSTGKVEDAQGRVWIVSEEPVMDGVALRVVQAANELDAELNPAFDRMLATSGVALLLAVLAGGVLALVIARLEAAREELAEARHLATMGVTAAAIAHEVKNSLNGISVTLDLLASGATAATAREVHAQAREEIARLRGVADDLTLFASRPSLQLAPADLNDLCRRASGLVSDLAHDSGVEIQLPLCRGGGALPVSVDAQKLLGVLHNLARNAVEAMGPGAYGEKLGDPPVKHVRRLTISTAEAGGAVEVSVVDTGAGIDGAVRERLFEPFVTTKRTGTGLGLAIARRVIEAHGGRIEALVNPEGGTILRLRIPLRAQPAYPSARAEARTAVASP